MSISSIESYGQTSPIYGTSLSNSSSAKASQISLSTEIIDTVQISNEAKELYARSQAESNSQNSFFLPDSVGRQMTNPYEGMPTLGEFVKGEVTMQDVNAWHAQNNSNMSDITSQAWGAYFEAMDEYGLEGTHEFAQSSEYAKFRQENPEIAKEIDEFASEILEALS